MRQYILFGFLIMLLICTTSCNQSHRTDYDCVDTCEVTIDSNNYQGSNSLQPYDAIQDARSSDELLRMIHQASMNDRPSDVYYQGSSSAPTPDDAYDEGYDDGYEQGRYDGANGKSHGYGYDDSSSYYGYYEEMYQEGYEEGYDDGYYAGQSEYEEEEDEW